MVNNISDLKLEMITPEVAPKVMDFLRSYFFYDEPLMNSLKIVEEPEAVRDLENFAMKSVKGNVSIMAVTPSKDIVGVALNSIRRRDDPKGTKATGSKFDKVARFLQLLENETNTFERFPGLDKFLFLDILSVDPSWRGMGLSNLLIGKVKELAVSQGINLVRIDCSSQFSGKAAMRVGFEAVFSVRYDDYKENGEQVFKVAAPHTETQALVLRINM